MAVLGLGVVLLAGCATPDQTDREASPDEPAESSAPPSEDAAGTDEPGESRGVPATRELVAKAEAASAAGEHGRAAQLLERALRVAPRDAGVWQNLAVVRYRQKRYDQAETLAQRSNRLAGDNRELRRRNWALIAAARDQQGNAAGARKARQRRQAVTAQDASL
jgi:tetratricopeptide (TPR) repeat protein